VLGAATGPLATTVGSSDPSVPGTPNTGAGGNASINYFLLALSGIVALIGSALLSMKRKLIS
jgi:hypothetical protein